MDFAGGVLLVFNQAVTRLDIFCCLHGNVGPSVSLLDFGEELALLFFKQAAARHHVSLCFLLLAELTLSVGPSLANLLSLRRVFDFGIKFKLNYILKVPVVISRDTSEILTATERTKHFWTYLSYEVFLTLVKSHQVVKVKPYYIPFLIANIKILYQLNDHYPHCQWEPRSHNPWRTLIACDQLITQVQTPDSDKALLAKTHFNFIVSLQISLIQPGIYLSFWGCPRSLSPSRWQPNLLPITFNFLHLHNYCFIHIATTFTDLISHCAIKHSVGTRQHGLST